MKVSVAYANEQQQSWLKLNLDEGATVEEAISNSGILQRFPDIDLASQKVGVFGKLVKLSAPLEDGDRVEIYRAITRVMDVDDDDDDDD